jgi:hypothetical protein
MSPHPSCAPLFVKWLTHDLATPVATVMTASELLGNQPDPEINGLVQDGAARLGARLRLIRTAFAPGNAPIAGPALAKVIADAIQGPLVWQHQSPGLDGAEAAMIAGAALLLADLRRGEPLTITDTAAHWSTAFALPAAVVASLDGTEPADTRSAVAAMVAASARAAGRVITATADGISWA